MIDKIIYKFCDLLDKSLAFVEDLFTKKKKKK